MSKKIILLIFAAFLINPTLSIADFKFLMNSKNGVGIYLDRERLVKEGGYRYGWTLLDYKKPRTYWYMDDYKIYFSELRYLKYDCKKKSFLVLKTVRFEHEMAHRNPIHHKGEFNILPPMKKHLNWLTPKLHSISEKVLDEYCK